MKTNRSKATVMMLSFLALCLGVVSCYDDTALLERIEALETTKITTINQQIDAIKGSIIDLEATDKELDAAIAALIKENAERDERFQADVDSLKAKDAALEARIEELKAYVEAELASTKDWASATFSTLEQYQATCDELAAIKVLIAEQEASIKQALTDAIATSENSIKGWVNEQLTGYWTIAETQAKLDTIKTNTDKEVAAIRADLKAAKEELTAAYQSEIAKAIEDSEGKLSAKIDEINSALDKRIGAIEARLDAIEEKLNNLTREFAIEFDDTEIGVVPGGEASVGYSIVGATENTIVKALGQNGWSAKVFSNGTDKGTITVKAPNPITDDEIIVLVYDGEYRTIMSTINFVTGIATPSQKAIVFGPEADTASITLTSNLEYHFSIPYEAQHWLSVVETTTRATKTETISFACTKHFAGIRQANITFYDRNGMPIDCITIIQKSGQSDDITHLLSNPDFEDGTTGWTLSGGYWAQPTAAENGYSGKNFVEHWVAAPGTLPNLDCYQTIEVTNGLYVLTSLAHAVQQDNSSLGIVGVEVYANKDAATINTISASEYKVATVVEDGKLKVGYRAIETNANWIGWDNIRITLYAAESIDEAKVMYAKDEMKILATTAEELMTSKIQLALAEAIAANIELIETVATVEEAQALWDELKAQITEAKASAEAYLSLQAKIDQAYEWMEKDLSEGYDEFEAAIATAESNYEEAPLNVEETKAATTALDNAIFDFFMLNADGELEFPMTDLYVTNPTVRSTNTGWTYNPESAKATVSYNIAEFYNKDYDMSQTIEGLPNGMYVVSVTGYYRATGNDSNVGFNAHEDGSEVITAVLYANNNFVPLACFYEHNIEEINASEPTDKTIGGYNNFANSMAEAEVCFDKGFYANNAVTVIVQDGKLTFGIRDQNHGGGSWTAFRDFKLEYYGEITP